MTEDINDLEDRLADLRHEHRKIDKDIERLIASPPVNLLQIQRLKKQKLFIKDQIEKLKSNILPDIIA